MHMISRVLSRQENREKEKKRIEIPPPTALDEGLWAAAAAAAAAAVGCDAAAAGGPGTAAAAATGGLDRAQLFHHLLEFRLLLRLLLPVEGDLLAELARVGGRPRTRRRPWRRDRGRPAA